MPLIRSTFIPDSYKPRTDKNFNKWTDYIAGIKPENLAKKGGAGWEDEQESLLDQANEILTVNAKR